MSEEAALKQLADCIFEQLTEQQLKELRYCTDHNIKITAAIAEEPNEDGTYSMTIEYDETLINDE